MRHCRKCNQEFPATEEFFYVAGNYLNFICKPCTKVTNAAYRAKREGRPGVRVIACEVCGVETAKDRKVARFCSQACRDISRNAERQRLIDEAKPARRCVWCGADMSQQMRADAKFCSSVCNSKAHQSVRRYRRRLGDAAVKPRKEPLLSFIQIAERDGWRCQICLKPVNPRRKFPDPLAGSLDHIVPVSIGGAHELANVQLSHFRCNWSKRDRPANDQLRIIG